MNEAKNEKNKMNCHYIFFANSTIIKDVKTQFPDKVTQIEFYSDVLLQKVCKHFSHLGSISWRIEPKNYDIDYSVYIWNIHESFCNESH